MSYECRGARAGGAGDPVFIVEQRSLMVVRRSQRILLGLLSG